MVPGAWHELSPIYNRTSNIVARLLWALHVTYLHGPANSHPAKLIALTSAYGLHTNQCFYIPIMNYSLVIGENKKIKFFVCNF